MSAQKDERGLVETARSVYLKWLPTEENRICRCAGDRVCEYHELTSAISELLTVLERQALPAQGLSSVEVNALPDAARRYIAALETECDPAGTIRENFRLREENAGLRQECLNLATPERREPTREAERQASYCDGGTTYREMVANGGPCPKCGATEDDECTAALPLLQPEPVNTGLLAALKEAHQSFALAIAFLGRDAGTERMVATVSQVINELAKADANSLAVIAHAEAHAAKAPAPPAEWRNEIDVANKIDDLVDKMFTGEAAAAEAEIRQLLWDNKIGFVRLAQSLRPSSTPEQSGVKT